MGAQAVTAVVIGSAPGMLTCIRPYLRGDEVILCADGGLNKAAQAGLSPDWYVGDSDSGGRADTGLAQWVLPSEKDLTDLEMGVEKALELGASRLLLCGCTGGREDHHLANLFLLERLHDRGVFGRIVDEWNEITYLAPGSYPLRNEPAYPYFSLLPADRMLKGVRITGAKYELKPTDVPRGSTLTVSNEFLPGKAVTLSFTDGCAFLIRSRSAE